ncbi:MAG: DUF2304 family protein [Candidatus Altiarchaeales archaeon]|nr:DUF2304 family protein [Candidatus Altiarchaeales archaeon]
MIIEVFGLGFSIFALSRVYLRFREGKLSLAMLSFWAVIWLSVVAFLLNPSFFNSFSKFWGIKRPLDFVFTLGLIIAYYMLFRIYILLEELRGQLAVVVSDIAIESEGKKD